ncbi:WD40 repeat-like protein [Auricularia subglabra TFB-10046 SS5]|nr:WD40 repeat-like protein [Auricularia subglabra TFB-10046 SS5]
MNSQSVVISIAYLPSGKRIVSGAEDGSIQMWDPLTCQEAVEPLRGHQHAVDRVSVSPNGQELASCSLAERAIRRWDVASGTPIGSPLLADTHTVAYSLDGILLAYPDGDTICLWDVSTGSASGEKLRGHTATVTDVAFSPNGANIGSASIDKTIRLWTSATRECVATFEVTEDDWPDSIRFSPKGDRFATLSLQGMVKIWSLSGTKINVGLPPARGVNDIAFSASGTYLASGSAEGTICIWDAKTGKLVGEPLTGHEQDVILVSFSPDGRSLIASSGYGEETIRRWDVASGKPIGGPIKARVGTIAYSPDGTRLAYQDGDIICFWDISTGSAYGDKLKGHTDTVIDVTFSPDGTFIGSSSKDRTIRLWDTASRACVATFDGDVAASIRFSPDGVRFAAWSGFGPVRIWNISSRKIETQIHCDDYDMSPCADLAFSPSGKYLATRTEDGTVYIWDTLTWRPVGLPRTGHARRMFFVAFSPDGRTLVAGSEHESICIWDLFD